MNDDKDKILQACNSFSAEELFHFVREGDITLLDLIGAGLDDGKLVGLQELMAIEEDDLWAEVQTKRTLALCRRYLQAYPNGRYAGRCTKLMLQLADAPDAPPPVSDATPEGHQPATPSAPAAPPRQEPVATEEEKLWSEVQAKRTMQLCGRYLQTYPDGRHAGECAKIIAQLMKKQNEQGKHTPAAPPGGNSRPADTSAPAKQRKQNEKPSCGLLWGSIFLALLLALLARQLATGCSDDPRPYLEEDTLQVEVLDSVSEDTTNAPISDDTNQLLYDEVKQNLLYFRDKQTWDDNTFDATRRNLETLYYQKDEDPSARKYLTSLDRDVVTPYFGEYCSHDLRYIIEMEVNEESFDNFIDRLESQIRSWDRERQKQEAEAASLTMRREPAPKQKKEKAKGTNPSKSKAKANTEKPDSKTQEKDATPDAPGGRPHF